MLYAQFYHMSAAHAGNDFKPTLIEACGDRAVIILDDRHNLQLNGEIAYTECEKRGFLACRLFRGESFTRSQPVTKIVEILQ